MRALAVMVRSGSKLELVNGRWMVPQIFQFTDHGEGWVEWLLYYTVWALKLWLPRTDIVSSTAWSESVLVAVFNGLKVHSVLVNSLFILHIHCTSMHTHSHFILEPGAPSDFNPPPPLYRYNKTGPLTQSLITDKTVYMCSCHLSIHSFYV